MKKVKIMLMSLTVLAIIGGALAFKASRFNTTFCYIPAQFTDNGVFVTYYCPDDPAWVGSKACQEIINVTTDQNANRFTTNVCANPKLLGTLCDQLFWCGPLTTVYQDN